VLGIILKLSKALFHLKYDLGGKD